MRRHIACPCIALACSAFVGCDGGAPSQNTGPIINETPTGRIVEIGGKTYVVPSFIKPPGPQQAPPGQQFLAAIISAPAAGGSKQLVERCEQYTVPSADAPAQQRRLSEAYPDARVVAGACQDQASLSSSLGTCQLTPASADQPSAVFYYVTDVVDFPDSKRECEARRGTWSSAPRDSPVFMVAEMNNQTIRRAKP